ncbi:vacuolar membrane protein [Wolfiporia cocos MD-104 SS10]|uniref:E3 ubiquitin-protein ligase PEP5 n=1 Tax=Wolfiporia cocos (strain MD-104) TaxID=742152 RepID=A0A2H3JLZ9_WOLCO|nr:vacuolar membrane protein [Wolfiporia cocos MD-104 SS10]
MSTQPPVLTAPAWRQFTFFDLIPVKDAHDLGSSPEVFKKTPEISAIASSSEGPLIADIHGSVFLLNHEFEVVKSWVAHVGGRVTHLIERKGILITLGEEDTARHPFLKVWDLEHSDKKTGAPVLLRSTKVQSGNRPHPVSAIALSATLAYLAIGLADGTVLLYRHLDQSIFSGSTSLSSLPKARVIHESSAEPVTGLGFREPNEDIPHIYLFIVTLNRVLAYQTSGKGSGAGPAVVSEVGCGLGCAAMDWQARDMIVAKDEAIYFCETDNRGSSYAYEGQKAAIHTYMNYVIIVSPPFTPTAGAASATVRHFVKSNGSGSSEITKVTVFDPENKFVAYSGTFTEGVREVISAWDKVYVLANDGTLSCLEEKPTFVKLDMLYRKGMYSVALSLAKTQRLDESSVADVHRQFGDHLYSKGEYDGAMQQFVKTIGYVQPSYVIRKFLDAQRIHNLVTYLQELHSLGRANSDHTTLLLNTYTKLKDVTRLDSFIKRESSRETDELPFDLDTAIRVCRQAGYFEHASYLAKKYERHEDYLRIQIEDAGNYKDALMYLRRLGTEAAEANLARYGRAMLNNLPEETTQLLIDICTSLAPLSFEEDEPERATPVRQPSMTGASYLSYLAINRSSTPAPTASSGDAPPSSASMITVKPGMPPRRDSLHDISRTTTPPPSTPTAAAPAKARVSSVKRPSPRLYFAHFIDHMDHFVRFLEAVALRRWGQSVDPISDANFTVESDSNADMEAERRDQVAVWNTLFELYLGAADADKALRVLKSDQLPYDPTHALVLCSTREFTPGLVLLWERAGMHEDVLRFWMDAYRSGTADGADASTEVVRALTRYGDERPGLYPLVLRFLTSSPELLSRHTADVKMILEVVEERHIMQPLSVVQVLSRNGVTSVGLVKDWLMTRIRQAQEEVRTDQQLIDSYRNETQMKLRQVEELSDPDHPRVFHVTQCSACQGQLDLPSVHFMCNHSYHQRCLGEHETECSQCARTHDVIRELRRTNLRLADAHDVFLQEVRDGGFAALAAGFGRGALSMSVARPEEGIV